MLKVRVYTKFLTKDFDLSNYKFNRDFLINLREYGYIHFKDEDIKYFDFMDTQEIHDYISHHKNKKYKYMICWE